MVRLARDLLGLLTFLRTRWQGLPSPGIDLAPLDPFWPRWMTMPRPCLPWAPLPWVVFRSRRDDQGRCGGREAHLLGC
jgi:hypothetical protein